MKTQRSADIVAGCLLALVGLVTLYSATLIQGGMEERLPPRTLPYTVGFLVLVSGIGLAIRSWRHRGTDPAIKWPDKTGIGTIVVTLLALAIYIGLMEPLGLPLATFLYVSFAIWHLDRKRWGMALVIGLISAAVSYGLFIYLLELSFPMGFWLGD